MLINKIGAKLSYAVFFFASSQLCGVATLANHSQEELTKFGYKLQMKVERN